MNILIKSTCHIGDVEYPEGAVYAPDAIPAGRLALWFETGLAAETTLEVNAEAPKSVPVAAAPVSASAEAVKAVEAQWYKNYEKNLAKAKPKAKKVKGDS